MSYSLEVLEKSTFIQWKYSHYLFGITSPTVVITHTTPYISITDNANPAADIYWLVKVQKT